MPKKEKRPNRKPRVPITEVKVYEVLDKWSANPKLTGTDIYKRTAVSSSQACNIRQYAIAIYEQNTEWLNRTDNNPRRLGEKAKAAIRKYCDEHIDEVEKLRRITPQSFTQLMINEENQKEENAPPEPKSIDEAVEPEDLFKKFGMLQAELISVGHKLKTKVTILIN